MEMDRVLIYRNREKMAEAVYKSESQKLFNEILVNGGYEFIGDFNAAKRDLVEKDIELILWKVNVNQKDLLESLVSILYFESEVTKKWKNSYYY